MRGKNKLDSHLLSFFSPRTRPGLRPCRPLDGQGRGGFASFDFFRLPSGGTAFQGGFGLPDVEEGGQLRAVEPRHTKRKQIGLDWLNGCGGIDGSGSIIGAM